MAESFLQSKLESSMHSVQDLVIRGEEPPKRYVHKGIVAKSSVPLADVSEIDLSLLSSPTKAGQEELQKLLWALQTWGCFVAINHGFESSFLDKLRELAKQFFALPIEEKSKLSREPDNYQGYGSDLVLSDTQTLDWVDRLYLILTPEDMRKYKFWPENPEAFRETLHEYTKKLESITTVVLRAVAASLKLERNRFLDMYKERAVMVARFNFYPPCPRPDHVLGLKPHADGTTITFLLQDKEVEGLQIMKEDQWFRVPIIPHGLFINIGDLTEIMSNGLLKSPVHRVVTNSERERISIAVFCNPNSDVEVGPVAELIDERRPQLYKRVKDYVNTFFEYYQLGQRPIDAARI
ncbi:Isopenicillin N synthase-like, Fe(2+) 2OG dioxygenase domain [Dillenia turbinata]|uniref:Isopenicillin N synthase-like, Fe(2+) 2OG dioxygenase domain n=1 Tax=Dillenia turbinata TaxID=194707 RepID=A0AAN8W308_9MAGN